jgi:hypothetical protein
MIEYTQRGFRVYASLKDSYGAGVDVIESSAAQVEGEDHGPWVWVYVEGGVLTHNSGATHLDIRDAERIRDALNVFIVEHTP